MWWGVAERWLPEVVGVGGGGDTAKVGGWDDGVVEMMVWLRKKVFVC